MCKEQDIKAQGVYFLRLKVNLKALWQLRELTIFTADALEHEDCAVQI